MARRIIIDTDPGQDDAVAILLALASPELEVLGITAVAGNVPLPLTSRVFQLLQCLEQKQSLSEIPEALLVHLNSIMALDLVAYHC